jgi:hypothetical protein
MRRGEERRGEERRGEEGRSSIPISSILSCYMLQHNTTNTFSQRGINKIIVVISI